MANRWMTYLVEYYRDRKREYPDYRWKQAWQDARPSYHLIFNDGV